MSADEGPAPEEFSLEEVFGNSTERGRGNSRSQPVDEILIPVWLSGLLSGCSILAFIITSRPWKILWVIAFALGVYGLLFFGRLLPRRP